MKETLVYDDWLVANAETFWGEIARSDHVLQIYDNDGVFLDTLTGFVQAAIKADENAVVVATEAHLNALEARLRAYGCDIEMLISQNRFIPLNVDDIVSELMDNGNVNESVLANLRSSFVQMPGYDQKKLRMFGELSPTLLAHGWKESALSLERLADQHNHENPACIFCAYPKELLNRKTTSLTTNICHAHSKMISGSAKQLTHVFYKPILSNN